MIAKLVQITDQKILTSVHEVLRSSWKKGQIDIEKNIVLFEEVHKDNKQQYVYGVLFDSNGKIIMICSLFLEYKFTRGLSQIYHLQVIYRNCTQQQQAFFYEQIICMLPGYKITGLNVIESKVFQPHQTFMQFDVALPQKNKPKL